jgi:hypothetical protein
MNFFSLPLTSYRRREQTCASSGRTRPGGRVGGSGSRRTAIIF